MKRSVAGACLVATCTIFFAGCGNGGAATAEVSGKVTYKGEPLGTGSVLFLNSLGQPASGTIGPGGQYRLRATLGSHKVGIESREPSVPDTRKTAKPGMGLPGKSLIPEKFGQTDNSGLTADVKSGSNQLDFDLKD